MLRSPHLLRGGQTLAMLLALAPVAAGHAAGGLFAGEAQDGGAWPVLRTAGMDLLAEPEETFLDPDTAFVSGAYAVSDEELRVRFDIAPGYYLYRERFVFAPTPGERFHLAPPLLPPGEIKEDEYFGEMEVYYGEVEAGLVLRSEAALPREGRVDVTFQGCADAGLCYPPITRTLAFDLDSAGPGAGAGGGLVLDEEAREGFLSRQDRVARSLATGTLPAVMAQFALFGLLLAFTPCVLPMVPILSAIILGDRTRTGAPRAFALSLVYVLAMALAYSGAGVLAGLSGAGLQAFFQHPAVIVSFSGLFVLLALSMFGFYRLQMPAAWQSRLFDLSGRQRGGTWLGVAAMGALSALVVGPCVAPPLAGALIYIAGTGDSRLGGLALFSLAMGMGVPLLVAGTSAGRLAPRAGPWMKTVERVFGVLLLGVAIYLLERVVPPWIALLLWAALLIVCAVYLGAFDRIDGAAGGWPRLWKGAGLAMLCYGVLLMVGAASGGGGDLLHPLRGLAGGAGARDAVAFRPVKGPGGLNAELERAAARGQGVMLDFYADWCVSCKEMERYTFPDSAVRRALAGTVLLKADVTANDERDRALLARFGLFGPPAILFFGADGRERPRYRVIGFVEAEGFRKVVVEALGPPGAMISAAGPGAVLPVAARGAPSGRAP